jgi:hypothetical protein
MVKKSIGQSHIDWSGEPSDVVVNAGVIVAGLDNADDALHGFMGTIDWFGSLIVGT